MNYTSIHDSLIERARTRIYDSKLHQNHHIIPRCEDPNSEEIVPLTFKEHKLVHKLRWKMGKHIGNLKAYYMMSGINLDYDLFLTSCSNGGKIGGRTTKDNNLGIFHKSWDRGEQVRKNYSNGLMDHIDFVSIGKMGGNKAVELQLGIHNPTLWPMRSDWAKAGAAGLTASGNRGGIFSQEWRLNNPEKCIEISSIGGKVGGAITGKMMWWNNGITNTRSYTQPDGFIRGMIMSEKKAAQVKLWSKSNKETK